jgi:sugar phosphate isomerase/epimerase
MLTAPVGSWTIEQLIAFAKSVNIGAFEVYAAGKSAHFNPRDAELARKVADLCGQAGIDISSLAAYTNVTAADEAERKKHQALLRKLLGHCETMGVPVLCCGAGLPPAGMSRAEAIQQFAAPFYRDLAARAADKGVKLALENWYATNIQHLALWELIFNEVPAENFGLNYDPSHLLWQDIDYLKAVEVFGCRIFHTHAKDTEVVAHRKAWIGSQEGGWWRYVIPGFGDVNWGVYIARLRAAGYDGVLSIEHEDSAFGVEDGFRVGARYLGQFI